MRLIPMAFFFALLSVTACAPQNSGADPVPDNSAHAYSMEEYQIYREVMDSPMSNPEKQVVASLANKHKITIERVNAAVDKVQAAVAKLMDIAQQQERDVRNAVASIKHDTIKTVVISGEFAGITYRDDAIKADASDLQAKVSASLTEAINAAFRAPNIDRVMIKLFVAGIGGTDVDLAGVKGLARYEFSPSKKASEYPEFWSKIGGTYKEGAIIK